MATRSEVELFLNQFKVKLEIWDRLNVVRSIEVEDYSEGPIKDQLNGFGEMWVFGKDIDGHEMYIKITLGHPGTNTICISFHIAEYPMQYPLKIKEE